ncbi:hypothetical protein ACHHYP_05243 [Achlya hypogyna]|uniref:Inosine/uridine-preferring nucleoside hydrolase domain-containing protein n=1 Tax=Achlya hypogyna TaxID=1202772 RepID=A0A1V9YYA3_ACHHY|nr:hypothetical protein ACHHYP_05243 [Achlya hypogyna]
MKLVIDTDAGLDDAISILMAVNLLPSDSVLAITSVFGNVDLHQVNHNLKHILARTNHPKIPVFSGAATPLVSSVGEKWDGHGVDGLGGAIGLAPYVPPAANDAVPALIRLAQEHAHELTIVAIGPATNLALAATLDPNFVTNIKEVIYMGCTTEGRGNTTPHAEFNVACDPEAAHILLTRFAAKLTVVSWEAVSDAYLPWSFFDELVSGPTPTAAFIKAVCASFEKFRPHADNVVIEDESEHQHFVVCDAYAMALVLADVTNQVSFAHGQVIMDAGATRGGCLWTPASPGEGAVKLVHTFDLESFKRIMLLMPKKVVIDTDAGVDDAIALLLAVNLLPRGSVVGVTSVFGNVDLHQVNHNLREILAQSAEPTIPVFSGAAGPIVGSVSNKWDGHGIDGLGGSVGVAPYSSPTTNDAVPALIRLAQEHAHELTIVAIGPATNLALAATLDPNFVANIKEVIYMGCTTEGRGNTTPHAEFNVACDPEAAHILLTRFAAKLTVVSWETVCAAHVPWPFYDELVALPTPLAAFFARIFRAYLRYRPDAADHHGKAQSFILCDAYATALLVADVAMHTVNARGSVLLDAGPTRGACEWAATAAPATTVVKTFDVPRFQTLLRRLIEGVASVE